MSRRSISLAKTWGEAYLPTSESMALPGRGLRFLGILTGVAMLAGPAGADTLTYENARFGTFVTFPAHVFQQAMEPPPRGEGMTFLAEDGASLAVFAVNNALDLSPEEFADQSASVESAASEVTYRRVVDNWVVLSGIENDWIFYKRFVFGGDDIIHGLLLRYPHSRRDSYDALVEEISASLGGP